MKKVCALFVFLGLLMASPLAYAETPKIGYFSYERVFNGSKRGQEELKAFAKRKAELEKIGEKKEAELKALQESLEKKASMLSAEAKMEKQKEYQQKYTELQRFAQDSNNELQQLDKDIYTRFMLSLGKVVQKFGEEQKYTLILEVRIVGYAPKEIDITDQLIKAFDAAKD
ncbi:MAG: OmpH family outer membrane protein [Deltaproteobacteria bacterium]|nr:OmpH family outer membrane protein [Deltaproteobacteria bacterium]